MRFCRVIDKMDLGQGKVGRYIQVTRDIAQQEREAVTPHDAGMSKRLLTKRTNKSCNYFFLFRTECTQSERLAGHKHGGAWGCSNLG